MGAIAVIMLVGFGWIVVVGLVMMLCVSARNGDRLIPSDAAAEPPGRAHVSSAA